MHLGWTWRNFAVKRSNTQCNRRRSRGSSTFCHEQHRSGNRPGSYEGKKHRPTCLRAYPDCDFVPRYNIWDLHIPTLPYLTDTFDVQLFEPSLHRLIFFSAILWIIYHVKNPESVSHSTRVNATRLSSNATAVKLYLSCFIPIQSFDRNAAAQL